MLTGSLPLSALRPKVIDKINKYLSLSSNQSISIGLYANKQKYIIDFGKNEAELSYDIGSVSKTLTGHLILKLAQLGLIDIYLPVSKYLHLKQGSYPTIIELMTHTAGYRHLTPIEITLPMLLRHRYSHRNPYENANCDDVIKALERRNRKSKKYSYRYSDFSHAILSLVAEKVTGQDFCDLICDLAQNEMNMTNTFIKRTKLKPDATYKNKSVPFWKWEKNNPYIAAGGLVSNIYDMISYISLQIESNENYIVNGHKVFQDSFSSRSSVGTTLCWHTYKNSNQLWHVGGVGTFRSSVIINIQKKLGIAVLGNSKGISSANVHYIAKMLYSELKMKKINTNLNSSRK